MQVVPAAYNCAWCGESNDTFIDPSQGDNQQYIEDCQVCCSPNILMVSGVYPDFQIDAIPE